MTALASQRNSILICCSACCDELGADVNPQGCGHRAFYNSTRGRIEMHLVSRRSQDIRLLGKRFHFDPGESIHTENSYKYSLEEFHALARTAGLQPRQVWLDSAHLFSVVTRSRPRMA